MTLPTTAVPMVLPITQLRRSLRKFVTVTPPTLGLRVIFSTIRTAARFMPVGLVLCALTGAGFGYGWGLPGISELKAQESATLQGLPNWTASWPNTDFSRHVVSVHEIISGGPPRDGIPPIDQPLFEPVGTNIAGLEETPVISVKVGDTARAYPLSILIWHEIVNDVIEGKPLAITFCPLCNSAIVFDRKLNGRVLRLGTSGKLRNSDLVMWDDATESLWQQFTGQAIIGEWAGQKLHFFPSRLESRGSFMERYGPQAEVLIPNEPNLRPYGTNPYVDYDLGRPFLFSGEIPDGLPPLERVFSFEERDQAWALPWLVERGQVVLEDGTELNWRPGARSALEKRQIQESRDVGIVTAFKNGKERTVFVDFAFAFYAFHPDSPIVH